MFLYIYDCSHRCISLPNASSSLACQNCSYKPGTLCTNAHMSWDFLTLAEQLKAATQYFLPRASAMSIYRYICMYYTCMIQILIYSALCNISPMTLASVPKTKSHGVQQGNQEPAEGSVNRRVHWPPMEALP